MSRARCGGDPLGDGRFGAAGARQDLVVQGEHVAPQVDVQPCGGQAGYLGQEGAVGVVDIQPVVAGEHLPRGRLEVFQDVQVSLRLDAEVCDHDGRGALRMQAGHRGAAGEAVHRVALDVERADAALRVVIAGLLPRRKIAARTIGKTYTTPDGKQFRPSLFITLTCPSYGRVNEDGTPANPDSYDYVRAARDALHFAALFDRFVQNLRRFLGYDVQYFAAIEPQRRLAPHIHLAMRGTVSRADLRQVLAATYHQVWWPDTSTVRFDGQELPVWDQETSTYLDPTTGEVLPAWDDALDAIGPDDEPLHVARFGNRFDAQGVLSGSKDAARCIGYLTKYLTKQVADCHQATSDTQRAHVERLAEALRYEPCSPRCANWLRYGIQPKNARPGLIPGACKGKAHRREYLGYPGRRVLVSRKWSGKTLADHRADRKTWLLTTLGQTATDPARYAWEPVAPGDPDYMEHARRLLHVVADRQHWHAALAEARRRAGLQKAGPLPDGRAA